MMAMVIAMQVFIACTESDDIFVDPVEPMSAVDNGEWPVPADAADTTVRPGDDFFMHSNGGFWKNTTVDESKAENHCWLKVEVPQLMTQRINALNIPSLEKVKRDIAVRDEATLSKQQQRIMYALARANAVTTREEAWQLAAQLMMEGFQMPFSLIPFSRNGRMVVCIGSQTNFDYLPKLLTTEDDIAWRLKNDPKVLASVRPITESGVTRSIDSEKWPMLVSIMQSLGISPDDTYVIEENPEYKIYGQLEIIVDILSNLQNYTADEWKYKVFTPYIRINSILFDDEQLESFSQAMATSLTHDDLVKNISSNYLNYERSKAFADAYITAEMKQRTLDICEDMRETFRRRITASTWMSPASKEKVHEKIDAMIFNVGYPDEWMKEGLPDLSNEETILDDVLALRRTKLRFNIHLIGMPTAKVSFHDGIVNNIDFTVVNAFYNPNHNAMNVWPAWMMEPYYQEGANEAYNYAAFMVTGHEMTHGFDNNGAHFNKLGDLEDIWANEADNEEFKRRAQQLIDCYNGYEVMPWALPGLYADGAYTVAENIADLGGCLMAYDTYVRHLEESGFTGEQFDLQRRRFYEAYAWMLHGKYTAKFAEMYVKGTDEKGTGKNVHSLFRERINGICSNTDDWYELFHIDPNDKLYRKYEDRVRIW